MARPSNLALVALLVSLPARAGAQCPEDGALMVGLSAAAGLGAGTATSLASSAIIASADDGRDYHFATGFLVGTAVAGGLSALYGVIDGSTGCAVVREQGGFAWSIPLTMGILGSLLPLAIWGAADERDDVASTGSALGRAPASVQLTIPF